MASLKHPFQEIAKTYPEFQPVDEILVLLKKAFEITDRLESLLQSSSKVRLILLHAGQEYLQNSKNYSFSRRNTSRMMNIVYKNLEKKEKNINISIGNYFKILSMIQEKLNSLNMAIYYDSAEGMFLLIHSSYCKNKCIFFTDSAVYANPLYLKSMYQSFVKQFPQIKSYQDSRRNYATSLSVKALPPPQMSLIRQNSIPESLQRTSSEPTMFLPSRSSSAMTDPASPTPRTLSQTHLGGKPNKTRRKKMKRKGSRRQKRTHPSK